MAAAKRTRLPLLAPADAEALCRPIHALGDYGHVTVRADRGHLNIFVDEGPPVARFTPLGGGQFGLSFQVGADAVCR